MDASDRTLYLYVDDDLMAGVCLESLLGSSFEILAAGEGESGISLLETMTLDWVIVDFDLPDENAGAYIRSSGKLRPTHGFLVLSGATHGVIAWEKLHGTMPTWRAQRRPLAPQAFLSLLSAERKVQPASERP